MLKLDINLNAPLMNAAGSLGFAPEARQMEVFVGLGAFITNPISLGERTPARGPRLLPYPGGYLLHSGHPNPGLSAVIRRFAERWARSPRPVYVHVLGQTSAEVSRMVQALEGLEGVAGIELGLPPQADEAQCRTLIQAALGELPVIARLPFETALTLAESLAESGAAAFSLSAPRGMLKAPNGELVSGRLYGPAVFPHALALAAQLSQLGLPLISAGGATKRADADAMLAAGAVAVQLDSVLWLGGFED